jgi:hypothetical protein
VKFFGTRPLHESENSCTYCFSTVMVITHMHLNVTLYVNCLFLLLLFSPPPSHHHSVFNLSEFIICTYPNLSPFQSFKGHSGCIHRVWQISLQHGLVYGRFLAIFCNKFFLWPLDIAVVVSCIKHIGQNKNIF